jgi:predicted HD superfamily hydrolase involved in NAD metabolism
MLSFDEMQLKLRGSISPHRYAHSLGVMETAEKLAEIYGADVEKCRIAGLLHDCAKGMSTDEMLSAIQKGGIELYDGEEVHPQLLHAPAGVYVAKSEYGVADEEILSAIRSHTVASKNMSLIDTIINVSDFIEPGRRDFEGLQEVRALAEKDIFAALEECKRLTKEYCLKNGQSVFSI